MIKTHGYKFFVLLFYLSVGGLAYFMYNLRLQIHVSPWDTVYFTETEEYSLPIFGDSSRSASKIRHFVAHNDDLRTLLRKNTGRLVPFLLMELRVANKHCSSGFEQWDSLLASSDPDRLQKFCVFLLDLAGPVAKKERLNMTLFRFTFFPKTIKLVSGEGDVRGRLIVDISKPEIGTGNGIQSIQGLSSFLLNSSACEK